jgi:hypothetical protein
VVDPQCEPDLINHECECQYIAILNVHLVTRNRAARFVLHIELTGRDYIQDSLLIQAKHYDIFSYEYITHSTKHSCKRFVLRDSFWESP